MFQNSFAHIFTSVTNHMYKDSREKPYIYMFQAYDFDKNSNKFFVYYRFLNSKYHSQQCKDIYNKIFQKSQRIYYLFNKCYSNKYHKNAITYNCNTDLNLSPLLNFKNKEKINIYHHNVIYKFTIYDIIHIINNSLLNHENFFLNPQIAKNPYNNLPFTNINLYSIYLFLKTNNYNIPTLCNIFFKSNLNLNKFCRENQQLIRHNTIKNYHKQLSNDDIYEEIILLFRSLKIPSFFIHIDFPKNSVIDKCLHLLQLYWHSEYEMTIKQRKYYRDQLYIKLDNFLKSDRNFARVILQRRCYKSCHTHFKIKNLLSQQIPDYASLKLLYSFMENMIPVDLPHQYKIDIIDTDNEDDDDDDDIQPASNLLSLSNTWLQQIPPPPPPPDTPPPHPPASSVDSPSPTPVIIQRSQSLTQLPNPDRTRSVSPSPPPLNF